MVHIIAEVVDANGIIVPIANNLIKFEIEGNAQIIGVENGDMKDQDKVKSSERKAFNGLCLAIIQSQKPGNAKVTAISDGIENASVEIEFELAKLIPSL